MPDHWLLKVTWAAALCVAAAAYVFAQGEEVNLNPIQWAFKAHLPAKPLQAGEPFTVELSAQIDEGWHLYSTDEVENGPKPTRISVPAGQPFEQAGEIDLPVPLSAFDPNFEMETRFYEQAVTFTIPVRALPNVSAGAHKLLVQVRYQTCTQRLCLPPKLMKFEAPVEVAVAVAAESKAQAPATTAGAPVQAVVVGAQVPDFSFTDFGGRAHRFSEYRGKYVLLDFWATWCGPCLADMPRLRKLYDKYRARGFEILGMDSETIGQDTDETDKETQEQAKKVTAAKGAVWTHATAATAVPVANKVFNVQSLPAKILVDKEGRVVAWLKEKDDLDAMLAKLLAGN